MLVADIEELEKMDASDIHAKRLNANEVLTLMNGEKFIFLVATGAVELSGRDQVLRTSIFFGNRPDRGEEQEILPGESDVSSLYVPIEESFPIALKYIDITRSTDTSLDVMLEKYR